jgi:peptidyl-prolyl cis-trans isomerase C
MQILNALRKSSAVLTRKGAGLAAVGALIIAWPALAQDLVKVNGNAITEEQVLAVNPLAQSNAQLRQQIAEQLAQQQLLADTVKDVPAALEARIAAGQVNMKRQALAQLAADRFLQAHQPTAEQIKTEYDKIVATLPKKQFWLRWIVVKTPDDAKSVIDALRSGKKGFTPLAIEDSIGQNAELGGALGWQTEQTLPAAVLGIVRKLKPGQVAGPIAFESGYAIVQLVAERDTPAPELEQLKPQIEQQLRNAALQQYVKELAKAAKIENLTATTEPTSEPTKGASHEGK